MFWRLLISPNGILGGEERDVENKTASLFALDVASGTMIWRNVGIDEPWWFHSAKLTPQNLYIHRFRKPDMPEPLGIVTLDAATGAVRWEQPDVAMLFEYDGKVYAQREALGRMEFFAIDSRSGEVLEAFGSERENILGLQALVPNEDTESIYSVPIAPGEELFEPIAALVSEVLDVNELRGSIDFADFGGKLVFSYHTRITGDANAMLANTLSNHLVILDKDSGDVLYREVLNSRTPYPVPDNFFIHRGVLIYVKETTELVGIPLR